VRVTTGLPQRRYGPNLIVAKGGIDPPTQGFSVVAAKLHWVEEPARSAVRLGYVNSRETSFPAFSALRFCCEFYAPNGPKGSLFAAESRQIMVRVERP
jgi:hypothetical protein